MKITNFENAVFLIPARKNSKGFPYKNRKLFFHTSEIIPPEFSNKVYVSTDDEVIEKLAKDANFNVIQRPAHMAKDESSLKSVLIHFRNMLNLPKKYDIILLFLTYPERTWQDICSIYDKFINSEGASSLMCCEDVEYHPYLCFSYEECGRGELLIKHNKYRRQDYPPVVKQSMFFACYKSFILENLHDLLFEKNTLFHKLKDKKIDIDYEKDYSKI